MEEDKGIVKEIFDSLSGDFDHDLDFLHIQKEKYKDHPRSKNIIDKITIKEREYLNKEEKVAYHKMLDIYSSNIRHGLSIAQKYFDEGKLAEAKRSLEALIKSFSDSYINDEYADCVCFRNDFEKELYLKMKSNQERVILICPVDKASVFSLYGDVLMNQREYKQAELAYELARTYNPFLIYSNNMLGLLYKMNKNIGLAKKVMLEMHPYLYKDRDLANFYHFMGNYCYEFVDARKQYMMYIKSNAIYPDPDLKKDIDKNCPVDMSKEYNEEEFTKFANEEGIPSGYNKETLKAIKEIIKSNPELNEYIK